MSFFFLFFSYVPPRALRSFPTRRSSDLCPACSSARRARRRALTRRVTTASTSWKSRSRRCRSEEHTSELQSPCNIVCRLMLEKQNNHDTRLNRLFHIQTYTIQNHAPPRK